MNRIGTAGWAIPAPVRGRFPDGPSLLARYAEVLRAAEINSSFHRPHRPATYARWAASVPADFRFSVKLPKTITHERRLVDAAEPLDRFLDESTALGDRRGPLLIQLPPSLAFEAEVAGRFLGLLRQRHEGEAALEPRHASWFAAEADALLAGHRIARVAADPALSPAAAEPGGWDGLHYWRWHGSPQMYASAYGARVESLAERLRPGDWAIFDNTMRGAATEDALLLMERVRKPHPSTSSG